jgi:hypothetical protein
MLVQIGVLSHIKVLPKSLFYDKDSKSFYTSDFTSDKTKDDTTNCFKIIFKKANLDSKKIKDHLGYEYSFKIDMKTFNMNKCHEGLSK